MSSNVTKSHLLCAEPLSETPSRYEMVWHCRVCLSVTKDMSVSTLNGRVQYWPTSNLTGIFKDQVFFFVLFFFFFGQQRLKREVIISCKGTGLDLNLECYSKDSALVHCLHTVASELLFYYNMVLFQWPTHFWHWYKCFCSPQKSLQSDTGCFKITVKQGLKV